METPVKFISFGGRNDRVEHVFSLYTGSPSFQREASSGGANCAHFDASALLAWPVAPAPPRWAGPPAPKVSIPVGAGPDELEAGLALDLGKRRVDRSREARIVELNREVVPVGLFRALLPSSTQLNIAGRVDAVVRPLVRRVVDALEAGLDVKRQRADRTGEAVLGQVSIVVCGLTF